MQTDLMFPWTQSFFTNLDPTNSVIINGGFRLLVALVILAVGYWLAKLAATAVKRGLETLKGASYLKETPVHELTKQEDLARGVETALGSVVFWIVMLVVFEVAATTAGLLSLARIIDRILAFLPTIFVSVLVLILGILLAGVAETLVKNALKRYDARAARLGAKFVSYFVMVIFILIAVSELGIAREYILVLFMGFVGAIALGLGLALGLGGQFMVREMIEKMAQRMQTIEPETDAETAKLLKKEALHREVFNRQKPGGKSHEAKPQGKMVAHEPARKTPEETA